MKLIKKITLCLVLTMVMAMMAGCGSSDEGDAKLNCSFDELESKLCAADSTLTDIEVSRAKDDKDGKDFKTVLDFDYSLVDDYFYAYSKSGKADEILVVKVKDSMDVTTVMDAMKSHQADRKGTFESYDPDTVSMVENATIVYKGNYCLYVVGEHSGVIEDEFNGAFE